MAVQRPSAEIAELKEQLRIWFPKRRQARRQMRIADAQIKRIYGRLQSAYRRKREGIYGQNAEAPSRPAVLADPVQAGSALAPAEPAKPQRHYPEDLRIET